MTAQELSRDEKIAKCAELRKANTPWHECAVIVGMSRSALREALRRDGFEFNDKPGPPEFITRDMLTRCAQLRNDGHTWKQCEAIIGINWRSLQEKMQRLKIKPKGRQGAVGYITAEHMAKGAELRKQGMEWKRCGEMLGVNGDSLMCAMRRAGIKAEGKPPLKATPELVQAARDLRAGGDCWKTVERKLGVNLATLANRVRKEDKAARNGN